jgi:hypothetical protein
LTPVGRRYGENPGSRMGRVMAACPYYSCSLKEESGTILLNSSVRPLHDCILHYAVYLKYIPHFEVFDHNVSLRYMVNS